MSERSRESLRETFQVCEARLQTATVGNQLKFWVQSECVSKAKGGFVWSEKTDGSVWMNLGQRR
eukprot:4189385-Karenia_brevis.AAC.1